MKHRRKDHHGFARIALEEKGWAFHSILRASGGHLLSEIHSGSAFQEFHLQPGLQVIAFGRGRVVARELELVAPFELQCDFFKGRIVRAGVCSQDRCGGQEAGCQEKERKKEVSKHGARHPGKRVHGVITCYFSMI